MKEKTDRSKMRIISFTCWKKLKDDGIFEDIYLSAGIIGGKGCRANWRHIANRILTNLYSRPDRVIYLRSHKHFDPGSYCSFEKIGHKPFTRVLNKLKEAGYVDIYQGGKFKDIGDVFSCFSLTRKLLSAFESINIQPNNISCIPSKTILLRDYPKKVSYTDKKTGKKKQKRVKGKFLKVENPSPEVQSISELLSRYNNEMLNHTLTWDAPYYIQQLYLAKNKGSFPDLSKKYLVAVFTGDMNHGGRMYKAVWVNMPKESRPWLKLDGEYLVDVDLVACHIALLYKKIWEKRNMPEKPYLFERKDPKREYAKKLLLTMVNYTPKVRKEKESEFNKRKNVIWASKILKGCYGDEYKTKYDELEDLIIDLEVFHKPINHFFYSGMGLDIQYKESNIMRKVMEECLKRDIAILPIHDGCMVKASQQQELKDIFDKSGYRYDVEELERDDNKGDTQEYIREVEELREYIEIPNNKKKKNNNKNSNNNKVEVEMTDINKLKSTNISNYSYSSFLKINLFYLLHKGPKSIISNKGIFKKTPIDYFTLANTPEKRLAEIPTIITNEEQQMLDSGRYAWVVGDYSNEVSLVLKEHKHLYQSVEQHNDSLSEPFGVIELNAGSNDKKSYAVWQPDVNNRVEYIDESEFCDDRYNYVKYVDKEDNTIRILPSSHDSIRAWQKISRATNKEVELYKAKQPLTMTEYVSKEEPVRYAEWGYSRAEGVSIEPYPESVAELEPCLS